MENILEMDAIISSNDQDNYYTEIQLGNHKIIADEPIKKGGKDQGASPYELLLASLGACSVITLRMYAQNKKWELGKLEVKLNLAQIQKENEKVTVITRKIYLDGNLEQSQKERLLAVAKACPVAKIITGSIEIESTLEE